MREIDRLRARLKNIGKNTNEYRMTVIEAHKLITEFEELEKKITNAPINKVELVKDTPKESAKVITRILDGGDFTTNL
jgi:hypothetical protein